MNVLRTRLTRRSKTDCTLFIDSQNHQFLKKCKIIKIWNLCSRTELPDCMATQLFAISSETPFNILFWTFQESYGKVVPQLVSEALTNDLSIKDVTPITANFPPENMLTPSSFSYSFYNFQSNTAACALTLPDLVVSFTNAVWYHSSLGHLSLIPGYVESLSKMQLCLYFYRFVIKTLTEVSKHSVMNAIRLGFTFI